ncbi:MAG: hypothetical protein JST46_08685 [Bacteroidetes bacterium]|nr:hypothetical protein [Bacteroidota bacterium]
MAKFNKNNTDMDISALTGNSVVVTTWHGRTVYSKKPSPPKREHNSQKQQTSIDRFKAAHYYAEQALKSEEKKALYAKGVKKGKTSAHMVAFQDFLTPPVIHYIRAYDYGGNVGDEITIKASDDFRVETVSIKIHDGEGKLLEQGNAERYPRKPQIWKYKTTVANPSLKGTTVHALAKDLPGNKTQMKAEIG